MAFEDFALHLLLMRAAHCEDMYFVWTISRHGMVTLLGKKLANYKIYIVLAASRQRSVPIPWSVNCFLGQPFFFIPSGKIIVVSVIMREFLLLQNPLYNALFSTFERKMDALIMTLIIFIFFVNGKWNNVERSPSTVAMGVWDGLTAWWDAIVELYQPLLIRAVYASHVQIGSKRKLNCFVVHLNEDCL